VKNYAVNPTESMLRTCPFCAEKIDVVAKVCEYCGSEIEVKRVIYKLTSQDLALRWTLFMALTDYFTTMMLANAASTTPVGRMLIGRIISQFILYFVIVYFVSKLHRKQTWKPTLEWVSIVIAIGAYNMIAFLIMF
jgi:hypothetical protein